VPEVDDDQLAALRRLRAACRRASCRFADRGMGLWYASTVDRMCRIVHAANVRQLCGS
jgi:hypothetical protein